MKKSRTITLLSIAAWGILIFGFTYLYYVLNVRKTGIDDYYLHNEFAKMVYDNGLHIMYPGYHLLVGGIYKITGIPTSYTAIIVLVLAICSSIFVTQKIIVFLFPDLSYLMCLIAAVSANIIQPIFTNDIRPGYNSGNGYISPTQALCKPFALFAIYIFLKNYREIRKPNICINIFHRNQVVLLVILILSCIAKPMFAMAFIPAMGMLIFSDFVQDIRHGQKHKEIGNYKKSLMRAVNLGWPLFITGLFLIGQYIYGLNLVMPEGVRAGADSSTHIRFGFLYAWNMVTGHVWLSILMAYVFPITLFITTAVLRLPITTNIRDYKNMCIAYGLVSFLYIACLYQDNGFEADMNFRNGWVLTFSLLQMLAIGSLAKEVEMVKKDKNKKYLYLIPSSICFLAQMAFGIALFVHNVRLK